MPVYSLQHLAGLLGLESEGATDGQIFGVAQIGDATGEQIAFADNAGLLEQVRGSRAAAVLVPEDFPALSGIRLWRVDNPRLSFLKVAELFAEYPGCDGVHPDASVHPDAILGQGVSVGACAVIAANACVGAGCCIGPGAFVAEGVELGVDCLVEANASLLPGTVLGDRVVIRSNASIASEGFGFVWLKDHHHRIPQMGRVEIGDDVEIGCNSCVDRATLGVTRIRRGCKIDNQVHVAHNCDIGEHVILLAHVAVAGSVTIGANSLLSGQTGVVDHVNIGSRVTAGGRSGITKDVADGGFVWGWPARDIKKVMREQAAVGKLPDLVKQVRRMAKQIEALQAQLAALENNGSDTGAE